MKKLKLSTQLVTTWEPEFKQFSILPSIGYVAFGDEKLIYINWLVWEFSLSFLY
jgi:hypothetical protein